MKSADKSNNNTNNKDNNANSKTNKINYDEYINQQQFEAAKLKIVGKKHNDKGIGTLSEKTVHAVLKLFMNLTRIIMKWQ